LKSPDWKYIQSLFSAPSRLSTAEWAEENIDYSLAPEYDTPAKGPFDADMAPYMRVVLDWLDDYETREIWLKKCSRACATEYVLAYVRRCVAEWNKRICYMSADMALTERAMEDRIKTGFKTCPAANAEYKRARVVEHDIRFPSTTMRVNWPSAAGAFRQDGWEIFIMDEYSKFKSSVASEARKRCASYTLHKIIGLSSPDERRKGSTPDPIFEEFDETNMAEWHVQCPKTGEWFAWKFGGEHDSYGLKWPSDAENPETKEWDLERVRNEAYYVTPGGARIENSQRIDMNKAGKAVAQRPDAPPHKKGLEIVGPMIPFGAGDFGYLAAEWLEAKRKGVQARRSYFCENWADIGSDIDAEAATDDSMRQRGLPYQRLEPFFECKEIDVPEASTKGLALTVDVQKRHLWYTARWWVAIGDRCECGLYDWGNIANFDDLRAMCRDIQPAAVGIDIGGWGKDRKTGQIHQRYGEVVDFCADTGCIALKGEDNMRADLKPNYDLDPADGRKSHARHGSTYTSVTWNTDIFRTTLQSALCGNTPFKWYVPHRLQWDSHEGGGRSSGREYVRQVMSTHKINNEWVRKKGYADDHMHDCEVMQMVLARLSGLIQ